MAPVEIPPALEWWRERPDGAAWLERLPRLAAECAQQWSLELEDSFPEAHVSFVAPAGDAVLKINFPDADSEHEADALAHWAGRGAVRLLAHDPERRALLVERCRPGTTLWELPEDEANAIAGDLLRRLWRPAPAEHGFRLLADEAERWAESLVGRPYGDLAVGLIRELGPTQGEQVVVHQDFHGGNVLRSPRGWLAIDPKPLVGEREFDTASLIRDRRDELVRDPQPKRRLRRRLDQLAEALELDRERMRGWAIAHALAWGVSEDGVIPDMIACARWLA